MPFRAGFSSKRRETRIGLVTIRQGYPLTPRQPPAAARVSVDRGAGFRMEGREERHDTLTRRANPISPMRGKPANPGVWVAVSLLLQKRYGNGWQLQPLTLSAARFGLPSAQRRAQRCSVGRSAHPGVFARLSLQLDRCGRVFAVESPRLATIRLTLRNPSLSTGGTPRWGPTRPAISRGPPHPFRVVSFYTKRSRSISEKNKTHARGVSLTQRLRSAKR
jgi:hypothetical protein